MNTILSREHCPRKLSILYILYTNTWKSLPKGRLLLSYQQHLLCQEHKLKFTVHPGEFSFCEHRNTIARWKCFILFNISVLFSRLTDEQVTKSASDTQLQHCKCMHISSNYLCSCANYSGVFQVTCLHSPAPTVFGMGLSQSDNTSTANTSNSCWTLIYWRSQLEVNTFEHETHQPEWKPQLPTHTQWQVLGLLIKRNTDNKECLLIA